MYPYINFFKFHIPTYGLCVCIAVFLCAVFAFQKAKQHRVDTNDLTILAAVSIGCGMVGGCLLYILVTYDLATICRQIASGDLSFLKNPGTVFYGGLIGGIIGGIITVKLLKIKTEAVEACVVPYLPLGHAIGRIGCLLAGCCYGFRYDGIFAISTGFGVEGVTYFPIQAVEAVFNLLIAKILLSYAKKERSKFQILLLYLTLYSLLRFCLEFFRGDLIRGNFWVFSTSQWISLIIFFISVTISINKSYQRKKC